MINGFDYSRYLREKKISGVVKIEEINILGKERDYEYYLFLLKQKLLMKIDSIYSDDESGFLKAILLGYTNSLDDEIKENFKLSSISHVLAISGMHISYIVLGLDYFLKMFIKNIKLRNVTIILFLIVFAIFVGESNSVMRACIMTGIVYLGNTILLKDNFFASFKFALCTLLVINPYNIFSGSMWLSFGGSIGIVLYSKLIEKSLKKIIFKRIKCKTLSKFLIKVATISSVTIGAQIVVFPIMIYIFNTFSFNFVLSNLLISELIGPILILGYLSLFVPVISVFEKFLINIILTIAHILSEIKLNQIIILTPKLYKILIYYCLLAIVAYLFNSKRICFVRTIKKNIVRTIFIFLIIIIFLFGNINLPFRNDFEIHFLDVGQGDSCLIRTTRNKVILIDGGKGINDEYNYGKNVLGPYLLDHKITKIDYMIVSHFDSDHCGGLFYIAENFNVENIVIGKQYSEYTNLISFLEIQKSKKINLIVAKAGDLLTFDKHTRAEILFPDTNNKISENEINNNSLVLKMYYKDISILFTGDIEEKAENVLLTLYGTKLKSDILKVGHHGSKTSSTHEFIELVKPKIALIGVGKDNNFGHPNQEVINRLEAIGSKVFRTDEMGEIKVTINKNLKANISFQVKN